MCVHMTSQILPRRQRVLWRAPILSAAAFATSIYTTAATPGECIGKIIFKPSSGLHRCPPGSFHRAALNEGRSNHEKAVCPSVCPSVRQSNACIVTKQKKDLSRFLYHTKDQNGWWGRPFYLKILVKLTLLDPVGAKSIFSRYSLVASQW